MNAFRQTYNGKLDREYLRVCAVYRYVMRKNVSKEWAVEKITEVTHSPKNARAVVEIWMATREYRMKS